MAFVHNMWHVCHSLSLLLSATASPSNAQDSCARKSRIDCFSVCFYFILAHTLRAHNVYLASIGPYSLHARLCARARQLYVAHFNSHLFCAYAKAFVYIASRQMTSRRQHATCNMQSICCLLCRSDIACMLFSFIHPYNFEYTYSFTLTK